jgi:hypothetical protein
MSNPESLGETDTENGIAAAATKQTAPIKRLNDIPKTDTPLSLCEKLSFITYEREAHPAEQ